MVYKKKEKLSHSFKVLINSITRNTQGITGGTDSYAAGKTFYKRWSLHWSAYQYVNEIPKSINLQKEYIYFILQFGRGHFSP